MAASTLRDLLSTTDSLFNKSDELNAELQRLVRAVQSRRAPAEAAEIVRLAAAGVDAASLQLLGAPAPGSSAASGAQQPTVLEKALADCRAASAAMCVDAARPSRCCCCTAAHSLTYFPRPLSRRRLAAARACTRTATPWWTRAQRPFRGSRSWPLPAGSSSWQSSAQAQRACPWRGLQMQRASFLRAARHYAHITHCTLYPCATLPFLLLFTRSATDEKYLAELRGIVASAGSAAAAPAAPATAAAPTEVAAAGEAAAAAPAAAE